MYQHIQKQKTLQDVKYKSLHFERGKLTIQKQ